MQQILNVNAAGAQRLLKLNVKKTKLLTIIDVPDDITIRVNNDPVEKVKHFKYIGSLKSSDGDCSKDAFKHRYGETNNVQTNHPVEGSGHPSRTESEIG